MSWGDLDRHESELEKTESQIEGKDEAADKVTEAFVDSEIEEVLKIVGTGHRFF